MARVDAPDKIAGRSVYTADVSLPGLCNAALVRSPFPHARIIAVDASAARSLPGVLAVVTGEDLPPRTFGRHVRDIPALARGETRFAGERVVAVVAESRAIAERAAARVRVEYEQLPAVMEAEQALAPGAPLVHAAPWTYPGAVVTQADGPNLQWRETARWGADAEAALAAAAHRIDCTYTTPACHQGYLEPQACVARVDPDGRMHLWIVNKSPYRLRQQLGAYFDLPAERFEVHPVAIGGDFGGKGSPMDAPLCLELARRLGRPVRVVLRYAEDLAATNPRHDSRIRVRLGCDGQGRLVGAAVDATFNGGAYAGFKPDGKVRSPFALGDGYRIPAVEAAVRRVYTNTVPRGNMRAPGAPQAVFAFESAMDELAAAAGLDPAELRRINLLRSGEDNPYGTAWVEARGAETLDAALAAYRPRPVPAGWRHGRGIAVYSRPTHGGHTSMRLRAEPDGGFTAFVPFPETGTGAHTVVARALGRALGVEPERVAVRQLPTSELPDDAGVGGSRVTVGVGHAVEEAARALQAQEGRGEVTVRTEAPHGPHVVSYTAQIAQVAVDPGTGQVRVLEVLAAVDVAEVVSPTAHRIQIEGGLAQGFGFACLEDLAIADGRVAAANLGDYRLPSPSDVPDWNVVLVPGGRGVGALNLKSIGELPNVPTAAAIANAVAAASGVRLRDLPLSAESVFFALHPEPGEG